MDCGDLYCNEILEVYLGFLRKRREYEELKKEKGEKEKLHSKIEMIVKN